MGIGLTMQSSSADAAKTVNATHSPLWMRFGSLASLIVAIAFLVISLFLNSDLVRGSAAFGTSIVIALVVAIFLTTYSLFHLRSTHRATVQAFRDTDCEFSSIFHNVLDGILILDDGGVCLDANPAAAAILRVSANKLVGENIDHVLADIDVFKERWRSFLQDKHRRGRARLAAGDGTSIFVDFTAAANYLPGRHVLILCDVTEQTLAELALSKSEERFQQMANNIQEIFWMMDAATQELAYVNRAYATITGHSVANLRTNPSSYRELIHPEDRVRVISRLNETIVSGGFDEEFRFTRADGAVRWIWAKGCPVRSDGQTKWLVGTAQDITSRKQAEMKIAQQLDAVEAARAEADALRRATLTLSKNLAMDSVLDALLQCISELVPFEHATVLFVEDGFDLMVAREAPPCKAKRVGMIVDASENVFLRRILFEQRAVLISDTTKEPEWRHTPPIERTYSWLGIPLTAAGRVLGILSLGAHQPKVLTTEHLRLAKNLGVSAAVAIQNARVHERAEIYAAELELRLRELDETKKVLTVLENRTDRKS
jgi:PAS domain S-box-containing protein